MSVRIINGKVYKNGAFSEEELVLKEGKIVSAQDGDAEEVYDAKGNYVVPGFIDVHTHGGAGVDVNAADETWFAAGIKRIFVQIRNACLCAEFPDQSRFSMKGRIMFCIDLIFITEHSLSVFYQHCSKGFIPMLHCQFGEFNRFFHKYFILHRITHLYPASDSSYAVNLHFRSLHQSYTFSPYVCSLSTSLCFRFILQFFLPSFNIF